MGRPPGNGGPAFRFTPSEVSEMEAILQEHDNKLPPRDKFVTLAENFSNGPERSGKGTVQMKQVMNWFQNKRYALKAKSSKATQKLDTAPFQAVPSLPPAQVSVLQPIPHVRQEVNGSPVSNVLRSLASHSLKALNNVEFEARSARDGAWYDVAAFLSVKNKDTDDPEVLVRFVGLTSEEDEWIKVSKHVRHRSLPCEVSECVAVLPGDLILCFQEATEQALYFDAHVLDSHRWKHDSRDCSCRFLVRYDHDQSEETVPLRKICRRPETDYRLQIYQVLRDLPTQQKNNAESTRSMVQAESLPVNDKFDTIHQKMSPFPNFPVVLEKITTCALEEGNAETMTEESASKVSRKAKDILDQDVATKKGRIDSDGNDTTPEPQPVTITNVVTQTTEKEDVVVAQDQAHITTITMASSKEGTITTEVPEDPKLSSMATVDHDPPDPSNNASTSPGGAALTRQNQTNGHNPNPNPNPNPNSNLNGGSSGNSDVPAGPSQQCF